MLSRRLRPRALQMRETVAVERPSAAAMWLWVWRSRRQASTASAVASGVWLGNECGREERSRKPSTPSVRKRLTHLSTVFQLALNWRAASALESPLSTTARTMSSRPLGVSRALLWVSIRFVPRESLRFGDISFANRIEWTTSCKFTFRPRERGETIALAQCNPRSHRPDEWNKADGQAVNQHRQRRTDPEEIGELVLT